jgi:hypothetical protein
MRANAKSELNWPIVEETPTGERNAAKAVWVIPTARRRVDNLGNIMDFGPPYYYVFFGAQLVDC